MQQDFYKIQRSKEMKKRKKYCLNYITSQGLKRKLYSNRVINKIGENYLIDYYESCISGIQDANEHLKIKEWK